MKILTTKITHVHQVQAAIFFVVTCMKIKQPHVNMTVEVRQAPLGNLHCKQWAPFKREFSIRWRPWSWKRKWRIIPFGRAYPWLWIWRWRIFRFLLGRLLRRRNVLSTTHRRPWHINHLCLITFKSDLLWFIVWLYITSEFYSRHGKLPV